MDIKFSVITATYNRKKYVRRTIESIMGQEYSNWELIVVDDGSTDGTSEVFEEIKDSRIIYIRYDENRGPSYARNRGIEAATGDYISFLDSDDRLMPFALLDIYEVISTTEQSYNEYYFVVIDQKTGVHYNKAIPVDRTEILYRHNLTGRYAGDYHTVTKRRCFDNIRFSEDIRGGESILWHRISKEYGPTFFANIAVKKVDKSSQDSISKEIAGANLKAWNNTRLTIRAYLSEFGQDMLHINPKWYFMELQRYAGTSLVCGYHDDAIRIMKNLLALQCSFSNFVLYFLAKFRLRMPLIVYHKGKRVLKDFKRR
jgi:glycosyltransferase involved in cell wall biosynthesis